MFCLPKGGVITKRDLPLQLLGRESVKADRIKSHSITVPEAIAAVRECQGNKSLAAEKLGIARSTLYRLLAKSDQALR